MALAHFGALCCVQSLLLFVAFHCNALPSVSNSLQPTSSDENFVVLTLNVANYNDHLNWTDRLGLMAEEINKSQPDVIALQEVRFDPDENSTRIMYQNMAEELLFMLQTQHDSYKGAFLVSTPAMFYSAQNNSEQYPVPASKSPLHKHGMWEGLSIISKPRIKQTGTVFLTKSDACADNNLRATQYVTFSVSSKTFALFNTHFGLEGPCLVDNVAETVDFMKQNTADYVLLVGDFNALPTDAALNPLPAAGLTDLWVHTHPASEPGFTFSSDNPVERIDYGWANTALTSKVHEVETFGTTPTSTEIYMSDHLGVIFTFAL